MCWRPHWEQLSASASRQRTVWHRFGEICRRGQRMGSHPHPLPLPLMEEDQLLEGSFMVYHEQPQLSDSEVDAFHCQAKSWIWRRHVWPEDAESNTRKGSSEFMSTLKTQMQRNKVANSKNQPSTWPYRLQDNQTQVSWEGEQVTHMRVITSPMYYTLFLSTPTKLMERHLYGKYMLKNWG